MRLPARVQTLVFDFDGTLCHRKPSAMDVFFDLIRETSVEIDPSAKRRTRQFVHYYWAKSPEAAQDIATYGRMTPEFWKHYLKRKLLAYGLEKDKASSLSIRIQTGMEENYQPRPWVSPHVPPTLDTLKNRGYTLGLVSNRTGSLEEELQEFGLLPYFNFFYTAGEINSWKPEKEIFEYALDLAQSTPKTTAYIGDNYYADIQGAQKVGLFAILLDPHDTFPEADCTIIQDIQELVY